MTRLRQSRDRWKKKAIERGKELRDLRRSFRKKRSDHAEDKGVIQSQQEQVVSLKGPDSNISSDGMLSDNEKGATPTIKSGPLNRRPYVCHLSTQAFNIPSVFQRS